MNRKRITSMVTKWRVQRKRDCVALLGGSCVRCGYGKSLRALTFHHVNAAGKVADISKMIPNAAWDAILEELKKCELLCFNCHMEEEERLDKQEEPLEGAD